LARATCSIWRRRPHLARPRAIRRRRRSREIVAHLKTQGQPEYLTAITEDEPAAGEEDEGGGAPLASPGSMDAEEAGRLLRPRRQYRAARPQMLDELYPAPPVGRL